MSTGILCCWNIKWGRTGKTTFLLVPIKQGESKSHLSPIMENSLGLEDVVLSNLWEEKCFGLLCGALMLPRDHSPRSGLDLQEQAVQ